MANRKQRRRRDKEKRHDYDLVEIDGEGNETVLTASELKPAAAPAKAKSRNGGQSSGRGRGRGRTAQPPSWQRATKRGLIFAPIFLITVMLLGRGKVTIVGAALQTAILLAVFVPFSYVMDHFVWRSANKRAGKTGTR